MPFEGFRIRKRKCTSHTCSLSLPPLFQALAWCPWQPSLLATGGGSADKSIKLWNASSGKLENTINTGSQVRRSGPSTDCWEMVYLSYYSLRDSTIALLSSTLGVNNYIGYIEKIESDENISLKSFPYRSVVFCGPHTIVSSSPPTATHTTTFPSGDPTPPMVPALLPSLESLIFLAMTRESSTYL